MSDSNEHKRDDEPVGYGRPPREHRFRKGRSGNPRGRPRNDVRPMTLGHIRKTLVEMLDEPTEIKVGGKTRVVPLFAAAVRTQLIACAQGKRSKVDLSMLSLLMNIVDRHEKAESSTFEMLAETERLVAKAGGLSKMSREDQEMVKSVRRLAKDL